MTSVPSSMPNIKAFERLKRPNIHSFWTLLVGIVCVYFVIEFVKHQNIDLEQVRVALFTSDPWIMAAAFVLVLLYIALQWYMYVMSFRAIAVEMPFTEAMQLYLKRAFLSAFLPGGSITNMFFFTKRLQKKYQFTRLSIYTASSLFTLATYISIPLIAVPLIVRLLLRHEAVGRIVRPVAGVTLFISVTIALVVRLWTRNIKSERLHTYAPKLVDAFTQLREEHITYSYVWRAILAAVGIELIGIMHMYLALRAVGIEPQLFLASIGYLIAMILLMSSPFLRGAGAIELALAYFFSAYGVADVQAVTAWFLFRFFEFRVLLGLGMCVLVMSGHNIFKLISERRHSS